MQLHTHGLIQLYKYSIFNHHVKAQFYTIFLSGCNGLYKTMEPVTGTGGKSWGKLLIR